MSICLNLARLGLVPALLGLTLSCAPEAPKVSPDHRDAGSERLAASRPPFSNTPAVAPRKLFENESTNGKNNGLAEPVVERGTGRLIGQPRSAASVGVNRNEAGDITLNVVDADIRDVVRLVLEDGLGANYVIDPAVTGSITVRTSKPVPAKDVVGILNSVLNLNGAALIEQGGLFKIVPLDRATTAGGRPGTTATRVAGRPGSGIQVAPLRYADGAQVKELLQPFIADQGAVQLDIARNTLILVGSADQVATMADLIDMFDVDWMAGMSFGLYPLKEVEASQLAEELDQIFSDPESEFSTGGLRLVPVDRLSALLVITPQPAYLDRAENWIKRLDKAGDGDGQQVFVYSVQNGRAADLASVLGELFDIQSSAVGEQSLLAPGLDPFEIGSSLPTFDTRNGDRNETAEADSGLGASSGRSRHLRDRGTESFGQRDLTEGGRDDGTRIVADETSNSLLIRATSNEYKKILAALKELDKQPLQVLLEATIAEVSLSDELRYGIQWFFGSNNSNVAFSDFTDRSVGINFPTGFTGLLSRGDVRVAIDALDTISDVNVISSPQILVLDNQTALLQVGDEVPITTQQATGIESDSRIINTIEQRQTGVILSVTPRVNASGLVVLDIEQEVSNVKRTDTSDIDSPTIAQRRIGTSVAVGSDQTVVLGGLIEDKVDDITAGIPFLKDIPLLGVLFGSTTQITSRTELMVLITPKVLTNQREAVEATNELRRRLRSLEPLQDKIRDLKKNVINPADENSIEQADRRNTHVETGPATEGHFAVQLASVPSQADAWHLWTLYQSDHAEALAGLQPNVELTTAKDKPIYRLEVGRFQGFAEAKDLCSALGRTRKFCLVIDKR